MNGQERITVQVRMEEASQLKTVEGFHSSDDCECVMREFLELCGFPYGVPFTCGTITLEKQMSGPLANRPGLRKAKVEDCYGENAFVLNDAAVSKIRIVCAGDFQNIICAAVADILNLRKTVEEAKRDASKLFRLIPEGTSRAEIEERLRWAVKNKGSRPYAEARLYQSIRTQDGRFS